MTGPVRGTCERVPEGWFCTRDDGHDGPCPAWPDSARWRTYGDDPEGGRNTIHARTALDVELDADGRVAHVWFRCMILPFRVFVRGVSHGEESLVDDGVELRAVVVDG